MKHDPKPKGKKMKVPTPHPLTADSIMERIRSEYNKARLAVYELQEEASFLMLVQAEWEDGSDSMGHVQDLLKRAEEEEARRLTLHHIYRSIEQDVLGSRPMDLKTGLRIKEEN